MRNNRPHQPNLGRMLLSAVVVGAWVIWRVIRAKPIFGNGDAFEKVAEFPAERTIAKDPPMSMPSLSKDTPGSAPLDLLLRTAAAEEKDGATIPSTMRTEAPRANADEGTISDDVAEVLASQSLSISLIPGWNEPAPDRLPVPTFAPAVMAMGIVTFAMGIVTTWYVCVVGAMTFAVAAWRWVGQLQGE